MSISTRRAKFRIGAAALTAATAAITAAPAAKATLTVNLQFANGTTTMNLAAGSNGSAIPVFVYATVTGANPLSGAPGSGATAPATTGNFDGLQYLYYNILNSTTGTAIAGTVGTTATSLNATLNFNGTGPQPTPASAGPVGAQNGAAPNTAGGLSIGSTTALTDVAKPRSNSPIFSNASSFNNNTGYTSLVDGTNIKLGADGKSVSFLVETLYFTPSAFTAGTTTTLAPSIPTLPVAGGYAPANWFEDNTAISAGSQPQNTSNGVVSGIYSAGTSVSFTDAAGGPTNGYRYGDIDGSGFVNSDDFTILASHFNQAVPAFTLGDLNGDGFVNSDDFTILASHFNTPAPAGGAVAVETSEIAPTASAVPEPMSLSVIGVLSAGALLRRKARNR